jgi:hypothetical protein
MESETFSQRFGITGTKLIVGDFPEKARIALYHLLEDLIENDYVKGDQQNKWKNINTELDRIMRLINDSDLDLPVYQKIKKMEWFNVYNLCERIYAKLLIEPQGWDSDSESYYSILPLQEVRKYYCDEINAIMSEEGIAYRFDDGKFQRKGYIQTQKNIAKVGSVLLDPIMTKSRNHFNKALSFFTSVPSKDLENCVKEAICAVEAALGVLVNPDITKNFIIEVKRLSGNEEKQVPIVFIDALVKFYGYRNNGDGVSHGNIVGMKLGEKETEFYLNICADYITYFYSMYKKEEELDIPF